MVNITSQSISGKKSIIEKIFFVSGYAVTVQGYTRNAQITVNATDRKQAIIRAAAQLRWEGLTQFKALKVLEITIPFISKLH